MTSVPEHHARRDQEPTPRSTVWAAGGVVWRPGPETSPQVLLVHRPAYDDWSLPKGKLRAGESFEDAARREVEEETGLRCPLDRELPDTEYRDQHGNWKVVRYWLMRHRGGRAAGRHEVDEVRWLNLDEAVATLSYTHDRMLLRTLIAASDVYFRDVDNPSEPQRPPRGQVSVDESGLG